MTKYEFLAELEKKLSALPKKDRDRSLEYYAEMIDEQVENGVPEDEAVSHFGSTDEIAAQILGDTTQAKEGNKKIKLKRRPYVWEVILLALGSPIWLALAISLLSAALSLYVVLWSLVVSAWAVFGALCGAALGGITGGIAVITIGKLSIGMVLIGAALVCAGLAIFAFIGSLAATKGVVWITKTVVKLIKKCFRRREEA